MKTLGSVLSAFSKPLRGRNRLLVAGLLGGFVVLVLVYSALFHVLMDMEGQSHSWLSSMYWAVVTMTTLGYGDITFDEDPGRMFSALVLLSGFGYLLVLVPFTFINFVLMPWIDRRAEARAPRQLPTETVGHLVLTGHSPIEEALIRRARKTGVPYVVVVPEIEHALRLHDRGIRVMVGALDDPGTYGHVRAGHAVLVAATHGDTTNTNIAFTAREVTETVSIVATATSAASVDILQLAGVDRVLQLGDMLGRAMAQRIVEPDARAHVIGSFADLLIAEAGAGPTPLVGTTLRDADLRARFGVNVIGVSKRGVYEAATADTLIESGTLLILAGTEEQLAAYDGAFAVESGTGHPVIIIGGGRVGRAVSENLAHAGVDHRIVEQLPERVRDPARYVVGNAAELDVLHRAGLPDASAAVVTTHDDDVNVYLTLYCRRLRPEMQIVSRANLERNVTTLYRAGADAVLSYASTGADAIWNHFRPNDTVLVAEGLEVFRVPVPNQLAGRTLAECAIRPATGCNVVALVTGDRVEGNPDADRPLPADAELVLIGDPEAEQRFFHEFGAPSRRSRRLAGRRAAAR